MQDEAVYRPPSKDLIEKNDTEYDFQWVENEYTKKVRGFNDIL